MSAKDVLAGLAVGAAAGIVVGILIAPDKGSETRKRIKEKGSELSQSIKEKYDDISEAVSNKYESTKEKLGEIMSGDSPSGALKKARENAEAMRNDVRNPKPVNS